MVLLSPVGSHPFERALLDARARVAAKPGDTGARLHEAQQWLLCGHIDEACARLRALEERAGSSVALLARIAATYTQAMAHEDALRCCLLAVGLESDNTALLANVAAAEIACGLLLDAERHLSHLLEIDPQDGPAYYNRAVLRRQSTADNHIDAIRLALTRRPLPPASEVPLRYALAKELEDLGEYRESFQHLTRGAALRRAGLSYRVEEDERALAAIERTFDARLLAGTSRCGPPLGKVHPEMPSDGPPPMSPPLSPIFIAGLPRSGTTLADRILSSHSQVQSLGEINDFSLALVRAAGPSGGKMQLIEHSARLDFAALGVDYVRRIRSYGRLERRVIDKTPRNYLYFGLIALSLPQAAIVHMRRDPLDTCYALYKTLFGAGSPYSYDLADLGRYYLAYHRLMNHWRELLPGRLLEIHYEQLVRSQEPVSRKLLSGCGLEWEPACLDFHRNASPAATASAAQVREPIHERSVAMWRHYQRELEPLAAQLEAFGVI